MIEYSSDDLPQPTWPTTTRKSPFFISRLIFVRMLLLNVSVYTLNLSIFGAFESFFLLPFRSYGFVF